MASLTPLFDTNILIDYLTGIEKARRELDRHSRHFISIITWMEVMAGTTPANEAETRDFLAGFTIHPITQEIAEIAVGLRRDRRIRLPDAMILATAMVERHTLITRNTKDFSANEPGVRVPYRL